MKKDLSYEDRGEIMLPARKKDLWIIAIVMIIGGAIWLAAAVCVAVWLCGC